MSYIPADTNPSAAPSIVTSLVRSVLIVLGTSLVAKGYTDAQTVSQVVGAILVIVPAGWGIWQKINANRKLKNAIAAPAGQVAPKGVQP